jgi:RNA-binding protein
MDTQDTPPAAPSLTPGERLALRARAHHLPPVVLVGDAGLTDAVVQEADRALTTHELIKVRIAGDDRKARAASRTALCERLGCALVQSIGKVIVLWRPSTDESVLQSTRPYRRKLVPVTKKQAGAGKQPELRPKRERPPMDAPAPAPVGRGMSRGPGKPGPRAPGAFGPSGPGARGPGATGGRSPGGPGTRGPVATAGGWGPVSGPRGATAGA